MRLGVLDGIRRKTGGGALGGMGVAESDRCPWELGRQRQWGSSFLLCGVQWPQVCGVFSMRG